jgi:hypothetical protein
MASAKPSTDTIKEAMLVAKDWKKMIDRKGSRGELDLLAAWGFLHFLISYDIVSEFHIHEIIRIFAMVHHKNNKKNTVNFCKDLGLTDRITGMDVSFSILSYSMFSVLSFCNSAQSMLCKHIFTFY